MGSRGLDNAGKTTIVKRIMNEDVTSVSPTLGFIIKTIDFEGLVSPHIFRKWLNKREAIELTMSRYKLNICEHNYLLRLPLPPPLTASRGCWRPKNTTLLLEKLLWKDRHFGLGCRCHRSTACGGLPGGASWSAPWRGMPFPYDYLYRHSSG